MKYIDEFRDRSLIKKLSRRISQIVPPEKINIMEVCGTHTHNFLRFGLDKILPSNLRLISGPGCPVCVSAQGFIDAAIKLTQRRDVITLTFGDMLRIPGTRSTLERERAESGNVRVVYSALDSLKAARENPAKKIVFLGVGFETTAPTIALSILGAEKEKLTNLFFLSALKLIPPVIGYLLKDRRLNLHGFLCPGHVSAIIGTKEYEFIPKRYKIGCCVAGFEPVDIMEGIYMLLRQVRKENPLLENQYLRVVTREGNKKAKEIMGKVFQVTDASWRGFGKISGSGLKIKPEFSRFDAEKEFGLQVEEQILHSRHKTKCRCGEVLKGLINPDACGLFRAKCTPQHPLGPCMVSIEGACNAYYKYR